MSTEDRPSNECQICANCRFLSFTAGRGLRCADPAASRFDRPVNAQDSCGRFRMSFAAAKRIAFRQARDTRVAKGWEAMMHQHLSASGGAQSN